MKNKKIIYALLSLSLIITTIFIIGTNTNNYKNNSKSNKKVTYNTLKKIPNFKLENLNRYIKYKKYHNNLSYENIITYINIGLDYDFYSFIKNANTSYNNLILVNKYEKLKENYIPDNIEEIKQECFIKGNQDKRKLKKEAKEAFEKLCEDSIKNNTPVLGQSAYRSYDIQKTLYENAVKTYGKQNADTDTARPGFSEHQTALAIDVSSTKSGNMLSFHKTESFNWMQKNAHKYGFILRYNLNNENIHGYIYEPWHYRYVGIKIATDLHLNYKNLTYDEYYHKYINNKQ